MNPETTSSHSKAPGPLSGETATQNGDVLNLLQDINSRLERMESKMNGLEATIPHLSGILAIAVDSFDEVADNGKLDNIVDTMTAGGSALVRTTRSPHYRVNGVLSLIRALRDPDRRRALAWLMDFLKHFGKELET